MDSCASLTQSGAGDIVSKDAREHLPWRRYARGGSYMQERGVGGLCRRGGEVLCVGGGGLGGMCSTWGGGAWWYEEGVCAGGGGGGGARRSHLEVHCRWPILCELDLPKAIKLRP